MKPFWEIESADWDRVINVNLKGTFNTCKAALPWLKQSGMGRIINFSSAVVPMGRPNYLHYVSSKAGVRGLTRAMAREVGDFNITVNAILRSHRDRGAQRDCLTRTNEGHDPSPLRKTPTRSIRPDRIGWFLCSDEASFITGQSFVVDGGLVVT